ncbi:dihydropteroate synthase [bacterium]|nr:dihydropteroate synthase [bacterium]RQV98689.1 MAG: dihydropteroate synthase [bacterium]
MDQKVGENGFADLLQKQLINLSKCLPYELDCGCRKLELSKRTHVMGILNATPDSFYDGGRYYTHDRAVHRIFEMETEGADLIDIGGESTRPGSEAVDIDEEINRVVPIIERIKNKITIPISIDTRKSEVAEAAIVSGAHLVNDVSGLRYDAKMASVIEKYRVPVVIMHMKGLPIDMQADPQYADLTGEIYQYLEENIQIALRNGISKEKIMIDPGIGFGKMWDDNFVLLRRLREFKSLGYPMLIGVSRKSFIGRLLNLNEEERLMGTAAAVAVSSLKGVEIVRVHDVKEMVQVVRIVDQLR